MRKLIVLEHMTLDGVIQGGGGPDEDTSGGFKYGGWSAPYDDETITTAVMKMLNSKFDLLLGRTTFDIWEPYWPKHSDFWPGVMTATKYVASNTRTSSEWQPTVFLDGDVAAKVAELKKEDAPDLHVWGSGKLVQTLMQNDLVDSFWLLIYPVTIGSGKRLFAEGTIPAQFAVTESIVAASGVIHLVYQRAGAIKLGEIQI